ncbi:MAG: VOC family protein [Roseibium sp.]
MIGYVTVGTNDFAAAFTFYDELLSSIGATCFFQHGTMAVWGKNREEPSLSLKAPHNGEAATVGNGMMVALKMADREQVDLLHAKGLELGAQDEGQPGARGEHGFYGAYLRDLDGNKLCTYVPG